MKPLWYQWFWCGKQDPKSEPVVNAAQSCVIMNYIKTKIYNIE